MDTESYTYYDSMPDSYSDEEDNGQTYYEDYDAFIDAHYDRAGRTCKKCDADDDYNYVGTAKPVDFTGVSQLKEIACASVAISLWSHENITRAVSRIVRRKCTKDSDKWNSLRKKVLTNSKELPVPKSVIEEIDNYVNEIEKQITTWVSYHFRQVFLKEGQDKKLYSLLQHIVYFPNGIIDNKQTAKSMFTSVRLTDVEKFKFLATYCLRDEMEQMSPLLFLTNVLDYVNFSDYPLIYYWYCHFRNELHKIPLSEEVNSIDKLMCRHVNVDNWPAKKYFFDRLSTDDQVQEAIWLIDKYGMMFQKVLLEKLSEFQRLHLYMERAAAISKNYAGDMAYHKDLLESWFDIRNLINEQMFANLFKSLLNTRIVDTVLSEIWTSACENFRYNVLNDSKHEIIEAAMTWTWAVDSDFIFIVLQDTSASIRRDIVTEEFFADYCEKLIANEKLSVLDRLLKLCIPEGEVEELARFRKDLVISSPSVKKKCSIYYSSGNLGGVNDLLTRLLSACPEVILECKKTLVMNSNNIFRNIVAFLTKSKANAEVVISTWCDVRNLITGDQFVYMFYELLKVQILDTILTEVWSNTSDYLKSHLLNYNQHVIVKKILTCEFIAVDVFLPIMLRDASPDIKKSILMKDFFVNYCEKQLTSFTSLSRVLEVLIPDVQELTLFKQNLLYNSKYVKGTSLSFYSSGDTIGLNQFLMSLLSQNSNLILEYKRNLLMSPEGNEKCVNLIISKTDVLSPIIADSLSDTNSVSEFKKRLLFSPAAVSKLQGLIVNNKLYEVISCLNRYLVSAEHITELKKLLIPNPVELIRTLLSKHQDESYCQMVMLWYFKQPERLVQFKQSMPLDQIFHEMLVQCVFTRYDRLLPKCAFRYVLNVHFDNLDRFLNWYFQSQQHEINKYKIGRIKEYRSLEMINTLLRRKDDQHLKTVMKWFFQNDVAEIAKFKNTCNNRKLREMI